MAGIDLQQPDGQPLPTERSTGHLVAMACRTHGAIIRPLGDTLVINPPLSINPQETNALLNAIEKGMHDVLHAL
jgi:adenosylmethionine-8-amino-7-oxononanoate aminotransferase